MGGGIHFFPFYLLLSYNTYNINRILYCHTNIATTPYQGFAFLSCFGSQCPDKTQYIPARKDTRFFFPFQAPQTRAREYQVSDTVLYLRGVGLRKQLALGCLVTGSKTAIFPSRL